MALICLNGIRFIYAALQVWNGWTERVHRKTWVSKLGGSWAVPPNTLTGAAGAPIRLARLVGRNKSLWARANSGW